MTKGSLPYSIARSLASGPVEPNYSPDGLEESVIDALIEQAYAEVSGAPMRTSLLSTDSAEQRRIRRRVRQVVRSLPGVIAPHGAPVAPTAGEAA
jgi:hypothetical protein